MNAILRKGENQRNAQKSDKKHRKSKKNVRKAAEKHQKDLKKHQKSTEKDKKSSPKRPLPRMHPRVILHMMPQLKSLPTELTLKRSVSRMLYRRGARGI
jgi:hypothetical protein